jgi:hypothetical protein
LYWLTIIACAFGAKRLKLRILALGLAGGFADDGHRQNARFSRREKGNPKAEDSSAGKDWFRNGGTDCLAFQGGLLTVNEVA